MAKADMASANKTAPLGAPSIALNATPNAKKAAPKPKTMTPAAKLKQYVDDVAAENGNGTAQFSKPHSVMMTDTEFAALKYAGDQLGRKGGGTKQIVIDALEMYFTAHPELLP